MANLHSQSNIAKRGRSASTRSQSSTPERGDYAFVFPFTDELREGTY
ncbi:MAG TPA: hypothetical protein VKQ72_17710 [Aggregatilineales bacterium]|nr:hypothetical protein [Aggregatilineales bacterium]